MRKYLAAAVAVGAVAALVSAPAAFGASPNTSTVDAKFNPTSTGSTLKKGGLFVETTTLLTGDPGTPTNPTVEPVPTTTARLDFDSNIVFTPASVPVCSDALSGTTQDGMKACGNSYVGGGYATVCGATGGPGTACDLGILNAQIAAYGFGGNKLKLQARADHTPVGPLTTVLLGTLTNSPLAGPYAGGKRLSVPVPLLPPAAPGAAAITDLAVNVNNAKYVQAKCTGDMDWDVRAQYIYADSSNDIVSDSQPCT